jgi:hypothetical protein
VAKKKTYEQQAKLSVILAVFGGFCTLAGAGIIYDAFDWDTLWVTYSRDTLRMPAIGGALFLGLASAGLGFLVGFNSAGQRLNKKNNLSWTGFFLSAAVITLAMSCGLFFFFFRHAISD